MDRKGRKFLLSLGTAGIILSLVVTGLLFHQTETLGVDAKDALQPQITTNQTLTLAFNQDIANRCSAREESHRTGRDAGGDLFSTAIFTARPLPSGRTIKPPSRSKLPATDACPQTRSSLFFRNPFASLNAAATAPLKIENAVVTPVPDEGSGWLVAVCLFIFMAFFAVGPGVCVWLALSELMPTRIRSNGMSIALLINQAVSTTIAAVFLPTVGRHGYSTMFFLFAGCTVIYFITAAFFLPETKGKTLEEIEEHFEGKASSSRP